ncbi:MAG TPA: TonB-dependent receptor [Caldimonas sp.]|nr:TonB-dependent receptor [Caldimonas sp.]
MKWTRLRALAFASIALQAMPAAAAADGADLLAELSLEELTTITITSVSGRAESLSEAAASIFVITADEIRRAGVTTLPEALRLAPNLQVARLDTGGYAVTARGFNNAIGNKLLVLVDGRTVYTSFFSGVLWDQQDIPLEDIDRIEVISGPGGTLWGTNAVNGVINVVSRSSAQTSGALAVVSAGNQEKNASVRYGFELGERGHVRVFAKRSLLQNTRNEAGVPQADGWGRTAAGFRADWSAGQDGFMLQGNLAQGASDNRGAFGPFDLGALKVSEYDLLGLWMRKFSGGADVRLQAYYDRFKRDDALLYQPRENVVDIDLRNNLPFGDHRILWGLGYRRTSDDLQPGLFFGFVPAQRTLDWANVFAQDEVKVAEALHLTLGARVEHNDFTGTEVLPSARLAWQASRDALVWAAASRAVRAPARLDRDIVLPPNPPYIIAGGPDFQSEVANVYELGYRGRPLRDLTLSVTGFYEVWNKLRSGQLPPNAMVQNMIDGNTSGVEAWSTWQVAPSWRLSGGLTTLHKDLRLKPGSTDPVGPSNLGNDPHYQWTARSAFDLPRRQELDIMVRRVAALPEPSVPAYTAVDARYGWRVAPTLEVALAVRNLLDAAHAEFNAAPGRNEIGRSVLLQVKWSP